MVRCSTPDTLIGLGGGGSRVVYRFMQQRWILDEVLDNGPSDGTHGPDTLRATTIDTATDEEWHEDRKEAVEETISAAISDSDYEEEDRYLEFEGPTIIPDEIPTGWKKDNLTSSNSIRKLREDTALNSWWLKNGRDPLDNVNKKGFASGVNRLRAVSKALYHIADHKDIDTTKIRPEGTTAIVTSLGGGTGSGLALDLALDLAEKVDDVHLFGVLPREGAGGDIKTNAHAALSELEYATLTDEGPFDTITLIPHLDEVRDKNETFEMAVVRTMIARLNGGDNIKQLRPRGGDQASAPSYAPFTFAYPITLRYDFEAKEEAKDAVEQTLSDKRKELTREAELYTVVEEYLQNSFSDTAGAELEGSQAKGTLDIGDDGLSRVIELQSRLEEGLYEDFLTHDALKVADLSETVEQIREEFENHFDNEKLGIADDVSTSERAIEFVELVPERLETSLENNFDYTEQDGSKYKLVEALKQEVNNVAKRRDIRKAISRITAEENPDLTESEAEVIRKGLLNVVLSDEVTFLAEEITNDRVQDDIEDLQNEVAELSERETDLEDLWDEVARDIRRRRNTWYENVNGHASRLAAVNRNSQTLTTVLEDLRERIEQKCRAVNNSGESELERVQLDLSQIGPLGTEADEINGIAPINSKLEEMGLEEIPARMIERDFEQVKRARKLEQEHGSGLLSPNNEEEFANAVDRATENGWFKVNDNRGEISVEDEFSCAFDASKLKVAKDIEQAEQDAITAIAEAFTETFTEESGSLPTYSIEGSGGFTELTVPQGSSVVTIRESLETGLRASDKTEVNELLNDVMPVGVIDPVEPSTDVFSDNSTEGSENRGAMRQFVDAYLHPIGEEYATVDERITRLSDDEDGDVGLITRLQKLRGLAEGPDVVEVELPKANRRGRQSETYGNNFAETYEGVYDFDLEESFQYDGDENPYVEFMKTDPADLAGDPDDIGDTDIVENRSNNIEQKMRQGILDLVEPSSKAPFNLDINGNATKVDDRAYTGLRIRHVFLSRGYEENESIGKKYENVYDEFDSVLPLDQSNDIYDGDQYPFGWTDDVSLITFVGGIFLDNIDLAHGTKGYKQTYEEMRGESNFPGSHHTIGLGAMWDTWTNMSERVANELEKTDSEADYGGYGYRETLYDPGNKEFIEEIMYRNSIEDGSVSDYFLDAFEFEAYENTVPIDQPKEAAENSEFTN